MGCISSKAVSNRESPLSEALERKLVHVVIDNKRRKSFVVKKSSFNNLMLQLPKLTAGFKKIREAHAKSSSPTGKVTWAAFRSACGEQLGLDPTSDTLKEVLSMPDIPDGVLVTHADFIVLFTVIHLMDGAYKRRTVTSPEVRACLELMEKSFLFFDSSADGCIERKELAMALKSGTRVFGRKSSKSLADRLFDQLDWSKDGQITFKEYLVGMERIIIETAGEEDDDADMAPEDDEEAEMMMQGESSDDGGSKLGSGPGPGDASTSPQQQQAQAPQQAGPQQPQMQAPQQAQRLEAKAYVVAKDLAAGALSPGKPPGATAEDEVRPFTGTGMNPA